jgi:hypothetical protein
MHNIEYLVDRKIITAGQEAASYNLLVYDFENPGGVWREFPLEARRRSGIYLFSLMVELQDPTYHVREGALPQLVGVYPSTVFNLMDQEVQSFSHPLTFHGWMPLDYGFGVLFPKGCCIEDDICYVRAHFARRGAA